MKSFALLGSLVAIAIGLGCDGSGDKPAAPTRTDDGPYAKDIEKLCDVIARSGADQVPASERTYPIATWLAANLETPEARKFLVRIQPLVGDEKAKALEDEARRVGLPGCALAAEWRSPATP